MREMKPSKLVSVSVFSRKVQVKTWVSLSVVTIAFSILFGVPAISAVLYITYQALFVALPGAVLLVIALNRKLPPIEFTAKAIIVGQCCEMILGWCFTALSIQAAYSFLPLLFSAAAWILRDRFIAVMTPSSERPIVLIACAVVAFFLVFSASLFNFDTIIDQHFIWVAAFANSVTGEWPYIEPFMMDVPLHYHYLYNIHVGMAARTMDIPVILVASRLAIVFHSLSLILCLFAFSSARTGMGTLGVVAAVSLLLTFGYSEVMWKIFHLATASIMCRVASTIVAFQVFILLLDEVLARKSFRMGGWLLFFIAFAGSGTRAMMLPMLAAGVSMLFLIHIKDRTIREEYAGLLLIILVGITAGAVVFLGLGTAQSDGTKLILINPLNLSVSDVDGSGRHSPLVETLLNWGTPGWIASLVYLSIALCGRLTFILPGLVYALCTKTVDHDVKVLLGGVALGGLTLLLVVETAVPQEIWAFYWYADIALALLGSFGLCALWRARFGERSKAVVLGLAVSALLFFAQVLEFFNGFIPKYLQTRFPTPAPIFQDASLRDVELALDRLINRGDVLVTGGNFGQFDERPLAARAF